MSPTPVRRACLATLALSAVVATAACRTEIPDNTGTFVGNPGQARIRVAKAAGLEFTDVELPASTITPRTCEGTDGTELRLDALSLDDPVDLPTGDVCGLAFAFVGSATLLADAEGGGSLDLAVPSLEFSMTGSVVTLEDRAWILELGAPDWTSADEVEASGGRDAVISGRDPASSELGDRLETGSALYIDLDQDGVLDADEQAAGPALGAPSRR